MSNNLKLRWRVDLNADTPEQKSWGYFVDFDGEPNRKQIENAIELMAKQMADTMRRELLGSVPGGG